MIRAVLFDLDGTLADTALDLGNALNALLAENGRPAQPESATRPIASHGARGLIRLGFGIDGDHPDFPGLRARYLDLYDAHFENNPILFPGVPELIARLAEQDIPWGIVTNKPERFTHRLLPLLPFPSAPAVVVSGDTAGAPKPDPRPMLYACEVLDIPPEHCLYLGDAERDIEAGRKVGMKTLIASWGYIAENDSPEAWGADGSIEHPLDLIAHL
ncbi:HAD family hydrolase [Crenobacter cavernae]|uniref:HAD family hydrolase n=1 Tax=Crenobacter cavernae TaxID=2290923 RepID=A0ABY0FCY7_9NEIS|nr:HAD-IA family hydrolase [Crenobacter cavernae]RXZ42204.1 HAD family hydrolase [Crenobacter cavernae]